MPQDPWEVVGEEPRKADPWEVVDERPTGASYLKPKTTPIDPYAAIRDKAAPKGGTNVNASLLYDLIEQAKEAKKTFDASPEVQKYGRFLGAEIQGARGLLNAPTRLGQSILQGVAGGVERLTGAPLDNDTLLGRATSPEALAMAQEDTVPGKIGAGLGDAGVTLLEGGAAGGANYVSKIVPTLRAAGYFGGKGALQAYDRAYRAGVEGEKADEYAAAHGALGATSAALPMMGAGENAAMNLAVRAGASPTAAKIASRIVGTAGQAEAMTVGGNMAERTLDPNKDIWDQGDFWHNAGMIAGMRMLGHSVEAKTATKPPTITDILEGKVARLGVPAPIEVGTGEPGAQRSRVTGRAETQLRRGAQGDDAIVQQILKLTDQIPPEVKVELRDHYAAMDAAAGVPEGKTAALPAVRPLSLEAQEYKPLLDALNKGFYDSYSQLAQQSGKTPAEFSEWHITRPVVEGVEPPNQTTAGASPLKSTSSSQKSRSLFAYREVGNPNGEVFVAEDAGPNQTIKGKSFIRTEATPTEIEGATGLKYSPDPFAAILEGHRDTNRALRSRDFRAKLANSDLAAPAESAPENWVDVPKPVVDAMPEFAGKKVSPLLSNYLVRVANGDPKMGGVEKMVDSVRRFLTGSIFAMPTAHAPNQITHFLGAYGAKDVLTGKIMGDLDWGMRQINDLHAGRVTPEMKAYLEGGMSMMSKPETANQQGTAVQLAGSVGRAPRASGSIETTTGLEGINKMNRDYTWKLDDALRLALFRKYQRDSPNASPRQISDEVSSFFPDYQRGEMEPYGGMVHGGLAKKTLMFNTYGSQAIEATANTAKTALKSPGKFASELGGLGAAYLLGKGASKALRGMTQDEETEVRGGGTLHILDKLYNATRGGPGNAAKQLSGLVHFNPIVKGLLSAGFQVTDPSFGQKVGENQLDAALYRRYLHDGNYDKAADVASKMSGDFGDSLAASMLPFSREVRALKQGETMPDTVTKALLSGRRVRDDAMDLLLTNVMSKSYSPYPTPYSGRQKLDAMTKANQLAKSGDVDGILQLGATGAISPAQTKNALMRVGQDDVGKMTALIKQADVLAAALAYREADPKMQPAIKLSVQAKIGKAIQSAKSAPDRLKALEAARLIGMDIPLVPNEPVEEQP